MNQNRTDTSNPYKTKYTVLLENLSRRLTQLVHVNQQNEFNRLFYGYS